MRRNFVNDCEDFEFDCDGAFESQGAALLICKTVSFDANHRRRTRSKLEEAGELVLVAECWTATMV